MATKYVICDPARSLEEQPGYAVNMPLEGWIFTTLLSAATRFDTSKQAEEALQKHYKHVKDLVIIPVTR